MSTLEQIRNTIKEQAKQFQTDIADLPELEIKEIPIKKLTPEIKKQIEKCKNLATLCLVDCDLQCLDNLPDCNLTAIDLSENKLGDADLKALTKYNDLIQIMLLNNKITKLQSVQVLQKIDNLQEIQLEGNPIASQTNYQDFIFKNLPNLLYLDGKDKEGNPIPEEQDFEDDEDDEDGEQFDDDEDEDDYSEIDESEQPQPKKKR